ncbi:MAG: hypothetical protein MI753_06115 [Hyphomicrobiales bacterium]|nr:hypothetical protein [Hyphomicrobiales bacterium]
MTKAVALLLALAMLVHIIKPLGLPGLRQRKDAWKIAVAALIVMTVLVGLRPG